MCQNNRVVAKPTFVRTGVHHGERPQCWRYGREGLKNYVNDMPLCDIMPIPNFMKGGTDVQAILRFCLHNLRGCNVGVTDERVV
jgi:hypothetical protein